MAIEAIESEFRTGALRDPHAVYRRLREEAPVYWSPYLQQWLVTSFELVEAVLRQPRLFSNFGFDTGYIGRLEDADRANVPTLVHHFAQRGLIQADPPEHTRLRRVLGAPFAAAAIGSLETRIRRTVDGLVESAPRADFDVVRDLAGPLPVSVIADLLGVPEHERGGFPSWAGDAVRFFGTAQPDADNARRLDASLGEWRALIDRLLEERRQHPQDDLLTEVARLVTAEELTHEEALFTCVHLLIAGHETTTNLIGSSVLCLLAHPEALAAVRDDQGLLPNAIEEVLRFEPPIQRVRRAAAEDCELGGQSIHKGDAVIPVLASVNRDEARFADPDTFDVRRDLAGSRMRHAAFGHGVHFCLGAPLARLEAPIAVSAVLQHFQDPGLPEGFEPQWKPTLNMRGLLSLPVVDRSTETS